MGRPRGGYFIDGERVPATTRVIEPLKNADALAYWAWEQGKAGKDFRETKDAAASAGKLAHAAVESFVRGHKFEWPTRPRKVVEQAKQAFENFKEWARQVRLKVTHSEQPLLSRKYRYGGTPDAGMLGRKRIMGDWKTSKGIYTSHLVQLAAYKQLWDENYPDDPIEGFVLVKFDKEHGDFTHKFWTDLDDAWETFKLLRKLYDLDKKLQERVK